MVIFSDNFSIEKSIWMKLKMTMRLSIGIFLIIILKMNYNENTKQPKRAAHWTMLVTSFWIIQV